MEDQIVEDHFADTQCIVTGKIKSGAKSEDHFVVYPGTNYLGDCKDGKTYLPNLGLTMTCSGPAPDFKDR